MNSDSDLSAWHEWKHCCALVRCGDHTRARLCGFAWARFTLYAQRYASRTNLRSGDPIPIQAADAWHLLETRLTTHRMRAGKRAKDWLFARAGMAAGQPTLDAIEGGATLVMRDVVRDCLSSEFGRRGTLSLDELLSPDSAVTTIDELLPGQPDPCDETQQREFEALATRHAREHFEQTDDQHRVALLARELGLSLAHPAVCRAAGCAATAVNDAYHRFARKVTTTLKEMYRMEDSQTVMALSLATLRETMRLAHEWAKAKKRHAALFKVVKKGM